MEKYNFTFWERKSTDPAVIFCNFHKWSIKSRLTTFLTWGPICQADMALGGWTGGQQSLPHGGGTDLGRGRVYPLVD
jgi:hypothetical protein